MEMKLLGQRIREARERLGLSQEEFAELVNRDQTAISAYENGKRRIAAIDLETYAEVLQVPITYFFQGDYELSELDEVLLNQFHKIPNHSKEKAIAMMRLMTEIIEENV